MKKLLVVYLLSLSLVASAKDWVKVCGEERYVVPENVSLQDAKIEALKRAKANALAERFGMMVSQNTTSIMKENNGELNDYFLATSGTELRGEWLEDIKEPEYNIYYRNDMQVVEVSVCGKARERKSAEIDLNVRVLRNGTKIHNESETFSSGDSFYLYFRTPIKGFVCVYLVDENQQATCLLPYQREQLHSVEVEANTDYLFFSIEHSVQKVFVDEYVLSSYNGIIQNQLYVIFSPNDFVKASDREHSSALRELSFVDFQAWLTRNRNHDEKMQVIKKVLTISE